MKNRLVIIGGGAAGAAAAIFAARMSPDVKITILERKERILKKLLQTGNGRCNYSNENIDESNYFGSDTSFVKPALSAFTPDDATGFFRSIGIETRAEDGRLYPRCNQAAAVVDMLRAELERLNVEVITNAEVTGITREAGGFRVTAGGGILCGKLIYAVGGSASLGNEPRQSHALISALGHSVTPLAPGLVQLKAAHPCLTTLSGQKAQAEITAFSRGKQVASATGELLFTNYGVSGIPILSLSMRKAFYKDFKLSVNFVPELNESELRARFANFTQLSVEDFFTGLTGKRVGIAIAKAAGVDLRKFSGELSASEQNRLLNGLTATIFDVTGDNGFQNAQVTIGGVSTAEVNPMSMESRIIPGLYICGEALDVAGDCGGYNLHFAWASAYLAAKAIG